MLTPDLAHALWSSIPRKHPLVFQLTNFVVMNEQAHVTLAVGAAPVMSVHPEETEELVAIADAVVVNIGTPTADAIVAMKSAVAAATHAHKPLLIDPVGYGATQLRTRLVDDFLALSRPTVIKGNAGEMSVLGGAGGAVRGVDSASPGDVAAAVRTVARAYSTIAVATGDVAAAVRTVARAYSTIAVATGEVDWASDGSTMVKVSGGHALLTRLTGTGCWLGAVIAAAVASSPAAPMEACVASLVAYGIAAELAARRAGGLGPASFRAAFIDALGELEERDFAGIDKRLVVVPAGAL